MIFRDRAEAGQKLARQLQRYSGRQDAIVLGIPRGGVPVAFEIAKTLHLPLDIFLSRKLGVPGHEELAFGAIAAEDGRFLDQHIVQTMGITPEQIENTTQDTRKKLEERAQLYRAGRSPREVAAQVVILVDDGIATGASIYVAAQALRQMNPKEIVIAAPVAPATTVNWLRGVVEDVAVLYAPRDFYAVGQFYNEFSQTSDEEVIDLLRRAEEGERRVAAEKSAEAYPDKVQKPASDEAEVRISAGGVTLEGILNIPENARGIVVFAHGSGSSRHSPRNRYAAGQLQARGFATLLFDLLTSEEEIVDRKAAELRFNISLLAKRLIEVTRWIAQNPQTRNLAIGYFGASTGAAAALIAAARLPGIVTAVVSRGGRPDLAGEELGSVRAATLLIVGGLDEAVIQMNRQALDQLRCESKRLALVPGATHLFEEPGTLEQVSSAAAEWMARYLTHRETDRDSAAVNSNGNS
jgi:putative phosphoribosyl transferase